MSGDQLMAPICQITISGRLKKRWTTWFDGMSISYEDDQHHHPLTSLTGPVPDRAALYGILNRIRDLNLKLISVNYLEQEEGSDE